MVKAMQDVDNELVQVLFFVFPTILSFQEVIEGKSGDAAKNDVIVFDTEYDWNKIEQRATLLGLGNAILLFSLSFAPGDDGGRDCDIILEFFKFILARWGKLLNQRDDEVKKSAFGQQFLKLCIN